MWANEQDNDLAGVSDILIEEKREVDRDNNKKMNFYLVRTSLVF